VNDNLSVPEYPNIYVIGDAAHIEDENGNPLPALAPVAMQQGKFLGTHLNKNDSINNSAFHYTDKGTMATIGRAKAVADIKGFKFSGVIAWFMWSFVHILQLMCFHNKARVFMEWIWYYFTFKRGVRLITDRTNCKHCDRNESNTNNMLTLFEN
jgi:NADH dehydrogenase